MIWSCSQHTSMVAAGDPSGVCSQQPGCKGRACHRCSEVSGAHGGICRGWAGSFVLPAKAAAPVPPVRSSSRASSQAVPAEHLLCVGHTLGCFWARSPAACPGRPWLIFPCPGTWLKSWEKLCQQLQGGFSAPGRSTQQFLPSWDYLSPQGTMSGTVPGERQRLWLCPAPCITADSGGAGHFQVRGKYFIGNFD